MKRLALPLLILTLAACSTTSSSPYDASGTRHLEGRSTTQTSWTGGTTLHLTPSPDGALSGAASSADGSIDHTVAGPVATGRLTCTGVGRCSR